MTTCKKEYTLRERTGCSNAVHKTTLWIKSLEEDYFIIAELDGQIDGFCSLRNNDYLNLMYVHKDYTQKGIANRMFEHIKKIAIQLGGENLVADVNKTARPFFEKKGFRVLQENRNLVENERLMNYKMINGIKVKI